MNLLLTLGHNSSAIVTEDGNVVSGYEEERLTRVKSASTYPVNAARKALEFASTMGGHLYVSHWFDDFNFMANGFHDKHWNPIAANELCDAYKLTPVTLTKDFTHHDAHAWAAYAFYEAHVPGVAEAQKGHIAVADGFGNKEEVFSLYTFDHVTNSVKLVRRIYGYENSLGLLYQYATSFCGMKENQDEYKFLGYESHVGETLTKSQAERLHFEAAQWAEELFSRSNRPPSLNGTYIDVERLSSVRQDFWQKFERVLKSVTGRDKQDVSPAVQRRIIGHFIQCIIECFYLIIVSDHDITTLIVTGGLHYNVKLNNHILSNTTGYFCAVPLAGDQGAALGLMRFHEGAVHGLNGLAWGHRNLEMAGASDGETPRPGCKYFTNRENYVDYVAQSILSGQLVNTITGSMEFGPRALCHTSTLALPTNINVQDINALNGRDTVMPMAPAMMENRAHEFFDPSIMRRVVGSLEYMILTLDYHSTVDTNRFRGVMHPYPPFGYKTVGLSGRPQLIRMDATSPIADILPKLGADVPAVINTSLNVHGVPIVYSVQDALNDFEYNLAHAEENGIQPPVLAIGNF